MSKKVLTAALIIATIAMSAQNPDRTVKKACIKMEKDENGVVTKIDTCITAATDEELQQKINAKADKIMADARAQADKLKQ